MSNNIIEIDSESDDDVIIQESLDEDGEGVSRTVQKRRVLPLSLQPHRSIIRSPVGAAFGGVGGVDSMKRKLPPSLQPEDKLGRYARSSINPPSSSMYGGRTGSNEHRINGRNWDLPSSSSMYNGKLGGNDGRINDRNRDLPSSSMYGSNGARMPLYPPSRNGKLIDVPKDDVHVYRNAGTHRVLPPSMTTGPSFGTPRVADTSDAGIHTGLGEERPVDNDERAIYQEALQNLGVTRLEDDLPEGLLSVSLLKHQKMALGWMVKKEASCHCPGGILADDQGLGKTISMIALIQKQREQQSSFTADGSQHTKPEALNLDDDETIELDKECETEDVKGKQVASTSVNQPSKWKPAGGTLVVCPASILRQWARELDEKVTSEAKLSVLTYHGGSRTRDPGNLAKYDVVLTTYSLVTNEVPKQAVAEEEDDEEQRKFDKYGISSEFSSKKRKETSGRTKGKKKGKGSQDSSINHDCGGPLARVRWFRIILDEAQSIKNHRTLVAKACSGLRAKRRWCLSGTPIQNSIDDLFSYFRFLRYYPYARYPAFCNLIKYPVSKDAKNGYKKLQAVLKAVLLRRTKGTLIDGKPVVNIPPKLISLKKVDFSPEERSFYMQLESDSRQKFKAYAAAGTVKQNYASILLMLLRLRQACDHPILVKEFRPDTVVNESLQIARELPRDMLINLLTQLEASISICQICNDPPEDAVVTMCRHVFCFQCVSHRLTGDDNVCPAAGCKEILETGSVFSRATLRSCISDDLNDNKASTSGSGFHDESSVLERSYVSSKIKAVLEILSSLSSPSYDNGSEACGSKDCRKIDAGLRSCTCSHIGQNPKIPAKAIIFSQWTAMLDLVEFSLNTSLIQYRRLDGSMTLNARDRAVKEFNNDPEVTAMLMSLKAGNLGLNMVSANHVILLDLWWNPTTEDQAVDRAHRIGQTRTVTVSRLTIKETVEDRILALQEEKRKMVSSAFGEEQGGTTAARLTEADLRYLFMI